MPSKKTGPRTIFHRRQTLLVRIRASQLQQCLLTRKKTSDNTIYSTLELIFLEHNPSGPTNLANKVSTESHTLECTTNEPRTIVPTQTNSSSYGRSIPASPATNAEEAIFLSIDSDNPQSETVYVDANDTNLNTATSDGKTYLVFA